MPGRPDEGLVRLIIKQLLLIIPIVFLAVTVIIYCGQRKLIYFPAKEQPKRQAFQADDMQQIALLTEDGLSLNAWYKPAIAAQVTIVYLHGNAGHIGYRMPLVRQFLTAGFGVLLLEYRGYGGNQGQPSEQGLYQDGRAAIKYLVGQGIFANHLVLYGESLGTGLATQLATEFPVCALVLQSPYTSLTALARYHYPWLFLPPRDKYDSLARIATLHVPILILHGKQDEIIPYQQALTLFQAANEPKRLISLDNKGHNNLWTGNFAEEIALFIRSHCSF